MFEFSTLPATQRTPAPASIPDNPAYALDYRFSPNHYAHLVRSDGRLLSFAELGAQINLHWLRAQILQQPFLACKAGIGEAGLNLPLTQLLDLHCPDLSQGHFRQRPTDGSQFHYFLALCLQMQACAGNCGLLLHLSSRALLPDAPAAPYAHDSHLLAVSHVAGHFHMFDVNFGAFHCAKASACAHWLDDVFSCKTTHGNPYQVWTRHVQSLNLYPQA